MNQLFIGKAIINVNKELKEDYSFYITSTRATFLSPLLKTINWTEAYKYIAVYLPGCKCNPSPTKWLLLIFPSVSCPSMHTIVELLSSSTQTQKIHTANTYLRI